MIKSKLLILFLLLSSTSLINAQTATQVNISGTNSVNSISNNVATVVDSNLTVTANGTISGFIVSITGSYSTGDILAYSGSLPSGISAVAFNTTTKSLVFTGTASAANWQHLLRRVTIRTSSATCNPESRKVSYSFGNKYFNSTNGHYYEYYATTGTWTAAKAAAASKAYFGRQCYIATLTSASENSFVNALIGQNSWLGCSDNYLQINAALGYTAFANQSASEGNFYWVTGPERGTKINSKNAWASGGIVPAVGVYNNWANAEPNDWPGFTNSSPGEEDYGHLYSTNGQWNDYANSQNIGTIFEYGGMPNDSVSAQVVFTRDLTIVTATTGTITGGNVSVCTGTNSTTLTLTGLSGTVIRWEKSIDNFVSNVTAVTNTTTTLVANNLTTTTYYRAVVGTVSGCWNTNTSATVITVNSNTPGNIVAVNNTICSGGNADFTLFGNSGSVVKWQKSNNNAFTSGVVDINVTTTSMTYNLPTTGTFYFRAYSQNSSCGSPVVTPNYSITVIAGTNPNGGSVNSREHCSGSSNSGTLTLSGHTGTISRWEYSTDGGVIWTNVSNTNSTLNYSGVGANRIYRVLLINGSCGSAYSSFGNVTVYGTTITRWDGGISTDWQNSSNWCGGVADNGIDIIVNPSSSNEMVLDQTRIVGNVNFNGTNRKIFLGNSDLTVASITDADSNAYFKTNSSGILKMNFVNGSTKTLPVGNSTYNPVTISNNTGSADYIGVRVLDEVFNSGLTGWTSNLGRVKRTWDIHKTNANSGSGLNFVFNWKAGDVSGLGMPALYHFESGAWSKQTGSYSYNATSLTYTAYTGSFSPFAISNTITPLPVKILNFDAQFVANTKWVNLNWKTADESNFSHFEVMKSLDGETWEILEKVNGVEGFNTINDYTYLDKNGADMAFYQLKLMDKNGEFSFSDIKNVEMNHLAVRPIKVYPNPSKGFVEVNASGDVHFSITDLNGKVIREGQFTDQYRISDLETGMYLLTFTSGENIQHVKLVVE